MRIDGKEIAKKILEDLKIKVQKLNVIPHLAIILVGSDPASKAYVNQKKLKAEAVGIKTIIKRFSTDVSQNNLLSTIQQFNNNNNVHGIIVQQPLPPHLSLESITNAIDPKKDVDGFHPESKFEMPIAMAVLKILEEILGPTSEVGARKIVVIGKGKTGGKPTIQMLEKIGASPTVIDSKTKNSQTLTKNADIIISAVGRPNIIKPEMVKKGVVLISIGLHKGSDGKLHGDYEEPEIKNIASFYTPTPGGVGPVNVSMLLKNLVTACENFNR